MAVIIIPLVLKELVYVINVRTGQLESFASFAGLEVMAVQHQDKVVMDAIVMNMVVKLLEFVTSRQVPVSVKITLLETTVTNVNQAIMEIQGMGECATTNVWPEVYFQALILKV